MKIQFKPLYLSLALALVLSGCGSAKMVSTPVENIDRMPLKTSPLKEKDLQRWSHLDLVKDTVPGMSVDKAYAEVLKGKKGTKVIVGIVDSGVDINHEDLKSVIWTNLKEIAGNNIDDDKNGYVDDYYGWNFLGGKDGQNVKEDSYEAARLYHALKPKYGGAVDESKLSAIEKEEYRIFKKAQGDIEHGSTEAQSQVLFLRSLYNKSSIADSLLKEKFKPEYNGNDLVTFKPANSKDADAKSTMLALFRGFEMMDATNDFIIKEFSSYFKGQEKKAEASQTAPKDYRGEIVKDNYYDFNDRFYGNPDVMASTPFHGTHVSGIIAAARNNGIGVDGVANDVRIMSIRAVPDGDEHDKDIALAIRYAVDNGAKIINMSFGKGYKWDKDVVNEAILYAQDHNVLLVHAAGNSSQDNDVTPNYPNDSLGGDVVANNWIEVGASQPSKKALATNFSNYGQNNVDVFAPGQSIYSTIPNNGYAYFNGTSMASPVCAGVCALVWSRNPSLTAKDVKMIMEASVELVPGKVVLPGTKKTKVAFPTLSRTGGLINAERALNMGTLTLMVK